MFPSMAAIIDLSYLATVTASKAENPQPAAAANRRPGAHAGRAGPLGEEARMIVAWIDAGCPA